MRPSTTFDCSNAQDYPIQLGHPHSCVWLAAFPVRGERSGHAPAHTTTPPQAADTARRGYSIGGSIGSGIGGIWSLGTMTPQAVLDSASPGRFQGMLRTRVSPS